MKLHHMVWPLLVFLLIWTGWVSGEVTSSFSASDGESSVGFSTAYGGRLEDRISDEATASFGGTLGLSRSLQVSGDLHETHYVNDATNGLYAGVAVDVWNADDSIYNYILFPGEGEVGPSPYVQARQCLTSIGAEGVQIVVEASNPSCYAKGEVISNGGTVQGYVGTARATADYSTVSQSVDHLDALPDTTTSLSTKAETWSLASSGGGLQAWDEQLFGAGNTLQVTGGSLDGYVSSSTAWLDRATSTLNSADVSVPEGWSKLEMGSSNLLGHLASVQTDLVGGEGSMKAVTLADGTQAFVKDEVDLECGAEGSIGHQVESENQNGDSSTSTLEVLGGSGPANLELTGNARSNDEVAQIWQDLSTSALQGSINQDVEATTFGCSTEILPDGTVLYATDHIEIVNGGLEDEFLARAAYGGEEDAYALIDVSSMKATTVDEGSGTQISHIAGALSGDELSARSTASISTQGGAAATLMPMMISLEDALIEYVGEVLAKEDYVSQRFSREMYSNVDPNCITTTSEAKNNRPEFSSHVRDLSHITGSVSSRTTGYYSATRQKVIGTATIDASSWKENENNMIYWGRSTSGTIDSGQILNTAIIITMVPGAVPLPPFVFSPSLQTNFESIIEVENGLFGITGIRYNGFNAFGGLTLDAEASNGDGQVKVEISSDGSITEADGSLLSTNSEVRQDFNSLNFDGSYLDYWSNIKSEETEHPLATTAYEMTNSEVVLSGKSIYSSDEDLWNAISRLDISGSAETLWTKTGAYQGLSPGSEVTLDAENLEFFDIQHSAYIDDEYTCALLRGNVETSGDSTLGVEASSGDYHGGFDMNAVGADDLIAPFIASAKYNPTGHQFGLRFDEVYFDGSKLELSFFDDSENPLAGTALVLTDAEVGALSGYFNYDASGGFIQQVYLSGSAGSLYAETNANKDPLKYSEVTFEASNVQDVDLLLRSQRDDLYTLADLRADILADSARWYGEASDKPGGMPDFDSKEKVNYDVYGFGYIQATTDETGALVIGGTYSH